MPAPLSQILGTPATPAPAPVTNRPPLSEILGSSQQQTSTRPPLGDILSGKLTNTSPIAPSKPEHPNMLSRISSTINDAGKNINDAITGEGQFAGQSDIRRGTAAASEAANAVVKTGLDVIPQGSMADKLVQGASKATTGAINTAGDAIAWLGDKIGSTELAQKIASAHPGITNTILGAAEDIAGTASNVGNVANDILAADGASKAVTEGVNIASDVKNLAKDKITSMMPAKKTPVLDEASVLDDYNRSIKPSVSGKSTASQTEAAGQKTVAGLKAIHEHRASLEFTNADGEVIKGETPKTVNELSQSIDQTKKGIFQKYDALAKKAGDQGVRVDTKSIAQELNQVVNSKALELVNPKVIEYAKNLQDRLTKTGGLDAETAQDVIQHYNQSLKAFYRNPTYEMASQVNVDALIANKIRVALDEGISGATGEQYQTLKDQYGALSSMEKDVARRASNIAKQANVGFGEGFTNVLSGAELVKALVTRSPADLVFSGTMKGLQKYIKYLNDPDVGVSRIFSEIDSANPPSTGSMSEQAGSGKGLNSSPDTTTFTPKSQTGKLIQSAAEKYKSIPNKEGGFVKIGGKTFKEIPEATKKEMIQAIDYLRTGKEAPGIEDTLSRLTQKYGISEDMPNLKIADKFEKLVEETKTGQAEVKPVIFDGHTDLSTNILEKLKGRTTVSKQFIADLTNSGDIKQAERDVIRKTLTEYPDGDIPVKEFADRVKADLLPLKVSQSKTYEIENGIYASGGRYENVTLPEELRGDVENYKEKIYESPIGTAAGDVHFGGEAPNYFAHSRVEDMADGSTRRVLEAQSDLFQKGRLEGELHTTDSPYSLDNKIDINELRSTLEDKGWSKKEIENQLHRAADNNNKLEARAKEVAKLEPYRNTWQDRIVREEIKQAAKDGKTKLQFPTGETAMKIEGLGQDGNRWVIPSLAEKGMEESKLTPEKIKVGLNVQGFGVSGDWVITDVLGDGKFKAVPKEKLLEFDPSVDKAINKLRNMKLIGTNDTQDWLNRMSESFDISGKMDTNNPIYKFYEKELGRYLTNKHGAKVITDDRGVKWYEVNVPKSAANSPVIASKRAEEKMG